MRSTAQRGTRRVRGLAVLALLVAGVIGAGVAYGDLGSTTGPAAAPVPARPSLVSPPAETATPAPTRTPTPTPTTSAQPPAPTPAAPEPVLQPRDHGRKVRDLQARLAQLAWFPPITTGTYRSGTRTAVLGFQAKRGLEATGVVDARTWRRLVRMSAPPTEAELFNRPGPALLEAGDRGRPVRELEARLRQIAWFSGDVDGSFDARTRHAVTGFQAKRGITPTGAVDRRTLDLLEGMTAEPTADSLANRPPDPADGRPLDPRCTTGLALCVDKTSASLRWVVGGRVELALDVRFGSAELPTREGRFSVYRKSRDHVSSLYDTSMPFAMFFSGGQAVHYSPDFAANGYYGASHGCVNVRDYAAMAGLFDQVPLGTTVVVYRS